MLAKCNLSIKPLKTIVIIGLLSLATHANAADSVMDVLKPYYPIYNQALQCHGVWAPSGSVNGLTNEPYMTGYCIDIDRQQVVETDKGKRLYVLVTGDVSFDENGEKVSDSRFYTGLVGMFVLKPKGNGWTVEAANPTMNAGGLGFGLKDWRLQQFAPYTWGFLNQHNNVLQGYDSKSFVILTPKGRSIIENWIGADYSNKDVGKCEEGESSECDDIMTSLVVDKSTSINGFYPLKLTINGLTHGKIYNNAIYRSYYQKNKGYQVPNKYPLKDMGY